MKSFTAGHFVSDPLIMSGDETSSKTQTHIAWKVLELNTHSTNIPKMWGRNEEIYDMEESLVPAPVTLGLRVVQVV